jgi:hypothetical protein
VNIKYKTVFIKMGVSVGDLYSLVVGLVLIFTDCHGHIGLRVSPVVLSRGNHVEVVMYQTMPYETNYTVGQGILHQKNNTLSVPSFRQ